MFKDIIDFFSYRLHTNECFCNTCHKWITPITMSDVKICPICKHVTDSLFFSTTNSRKTDLFYPFYYIDIDGNTNFAYMLQYGHLHELCKMVVNSSSPESSFTEKYKMHNKPHIILEWQLSHIIDKNHAIFKTSFFGGDDHWQLFSFSSASLSESQLEELLLSRCKGNPKPFPKNMVCLDISAIDEIKNNKRWIGSKPKQYDDNQLKYIFAIPNDNVNSGVYNIVHPPSNILCDGKAFIYNDIDKNVLKYDKLCIGIMPESHFINKNFTIPIKKLNPKKVKLFFDDVSIEGNPPAGVNPSSVAVLGDKVIIKYTVKSLVRIDINAPVPWEGGMFIPPIKNFGGSEDENI